MSPEEEINAQLIAQMMEEDANDIAAQQFQNDAFGGMGGANKNPSSQNAAMNDDYGAEGVR